MQHLDFLAFGSPDKHRESDKSWKQSSGFMCTVSLPLRAFVLHKLQPCAKCSDMQLVT